MTGANASDSQAVENQVDAILDDKIKRYCAELEVEMNRLRGRILGLIEAVGMEERQEQGIKSTLKALSYDSQAALRKILED